LIGLALVGCGDPNTALDIDKFTLQFRREAVPPQSGAAGDDDDSAGDDDDSAGDDDDSAARDLHEGSDPKELRYTPGAPVQKRVTITNGSNASLLLDIHLDRENSEAPDHEAFSIQTVGPAGLAAPYTHEVQAHARLELEVEFNSGVVGWNQARLVIEDVAAGYRRQVVLQGFVDCISLGLDQDGDGYCTSDGGVGTDCNDNGDIGFGINPGVTEVCEEGGDDYQVDNNCDGATLVVVDEDSDGSCDVALS
jgi:hypothetical protein